MYSPLTCLKLENKIDMGNKGVLKLKQKLKLEVKD